LAHRYSKAHITETTEQLAVDAGVRIADVVARLRRIAFAEPSEPWR
jgi:hypothetical protein